LQIVDITDVPFKKKRNWYGLLFFMNGSGSGGEIWMAKYFSLVFDEWCGTIILWETFSSLSGLLFLFNVFKKIFI